MKRTLVSLFDGTARVIYKIERSRPLKYGLILTVLAALLVLALARPMYNEDTKVYAYALKDISSTSVGRYVQVTGVLMPSASYQTQFKIGGFTLNGSRFIPLMGEGAYDPLFVIDQNFLVVPRDGAQATLVGKLVPGTGQQPSYYLEISDPPDIALMNSLARLGLAVLIVLTVSLSLVWFLHRSDYALSVPAGWASSSLAPSAPALLWYGSLGRSFGEAVLRQSPISFTATRTTAQFACAAPADLWMVTLRRLWSAQPVAVATSFGALPAVRIEFEDERGLKRRAVVAASSPASRDALMESLRFVGISN